MLHPGFREPINLTVESDNTFVMKVHPWISKESLNAAYRAMWTPWVGDCHPPTNEALDLLEFVLEHTDEAGKCPPWEKLRVLWNERFPARKFTTYSGIRRAHTRAKDKLALHRR
jgi:hypothetical protein